MSEEHVTAMYDIFYNGMLKSRPVGRAVNFDIWYVKLQVSDI
jgi:hypothetical protein